MNVYVTLQAEKDCNGFHAGKRPGSRFMHKERTGKLHYNHLPVHKKMLFVKSLNCQYQHMHNFNKKPVTKLCMCWYWQLN